MKLPRRNVWFAAFIFVISISCVIHYQLHLRNKKNLAVMANRQTQTVALSFLVNGSNLSVMKKGHTFSSTFSDDTSSFSETYQNDDAVKAFEFDKPLAFLLDDSVNLVVSELKNSTSPKTVVSGTFKWKNGETTPFEVELENNFGMVLLSKLGED